MVRMLDREFTCEEVLRHQAKGDAWLIIDGGVFDVSNFSLKHPGGDVLLSYAGTDASEVFKATHRDQSLARGWLQKYRIGHIASPKETSVLQDFDAMRRSFAERGLMEASGAYYAGKMVELLILSVIGATIIWTYPQSFAALLIAAVVVGCLLSQFGWAQHDFNHNQVFRTRKLNALVGSWVLGLGVGGSSLWWKNKHNKHHATPNKLDTSTALDPDIDTVPFVAWSETQLKQVAVADRRLLTVQHVLLWPVLPLMLFMWQLASVTYLVRNPSRESRYQLALIAIHHVSTLACAIVPLGVARGLVFVFLSGAVAGLILSFIFIQSHYDQHMYTEDLDFVTSQIVSTRNINPGVFTDWLMGGLNYQIEHHLFPTMPRHSYSRVRKEVMQFCARHHLPYETCSIWSSTYKVYRHLESVAQMAKASTIVQAPR